MSDYPEHDKLTEVSEISQAIGEFIDFGPYTLCTADRETGRYWPVLKSIDRILAEHFGIDLKAIDREKREMLESLRATDA